MRPERRCGNCRLFRAEGEPCASEDWVKEGAPRWGHGGECCRECAHFFGIEAEVREA